MCYWMRSGFLRRQALFQTDRSHQEKKVLQLLRSHPVSLLFLKLRAMCKSICALIIISVQLFELAGIIAVLIFMDAAIVCRWVLCLRHICSKRACTRPPA